jgi:hypothetical protein
MQASCVRVLVQQRKRASWVLGDENVRALLDKTMADTQHSVRDDIEAFEARRPELEASHLGKWVLFVNRELVAVFEDFEGAAEHAVASFGAGPYLIRRVGSTTVTLPTSVMYGPLRGINALRV